MSARIKNWKITIKPFGLTAAFDENYFSQTDERFQDVEIPFLKEFKGSN